MSGTGRSTGSKSLLWTLGLPLAAVAFMIGALNTGALLARSSGSPLALALFLPVSALLGLAAWMLVLAVAWRIRRARVRRTGTATTATVVESELGQKHSHSPLNFDLWRVRVEVRFTHPETGVDGRVRKEYSYPELLGSRARALAERCAPGASVPVLIRKNSVLIDMPKRPVWNDFW
ncbi:hypothetical protein [Nocardia sp. NPDC003345]